jgi:hypothetical protein
MGETHDVRESLTKVHEWAMGGEWKREREAVIEIVDGRVKCALYGCSDDTFGYDIMVDGHYDSGDDHDDCNTSSLRVYSVCSGDDVLHVCGQYAPDRSPGCWLVGVQSDDGRPVPPWPIHIEASDRDYSPRLVVEAPDDAKVTLIVPSTATS